MKWILWMKNEYNPANNKTVTYNTYLGAKRAMNNFERFTPSAYYTSYGICIESEFTGI